MLRAAGVEIVELPMLNFEMTRETEELDLAFQAAARGEYHAIVLSSPTAVHFFVEHANELGLATALKLKAKLAAVGRATSDALAVFGYETELPVPAHAGSHQLAAMLAESGVAGKRILLLQSQLGLDILEHALTEAGAMVERVIMYYTKGPSLGDSARLLNMLEGKKRPEVIAFFSPSAVMYFIRSLAEMNSALIRDLPALATIGETTAKAVEETLRRRPEIVARKSDQKSLAEDILTYLGLG
jgi:uroporphyrinogen-III synthase